MKKHDSRKLSFSKEKVANLSAADLDQVVGGKIAPTVGDASTRWLFTCEMCTTIGPDTSIAPQEEV